MPLDHPRERMQRWIDSTHRGGTGLVGGIYWRLMRRGSVLLAPLLLLLWWVPLLHQCILYSQRRCACLQLLT